MSIQKRITNSLGFVGLLSLLPLTTTTLAVVNQNVIAAAVFGTVFGVFVGTIIGLGVLLHVLVTYPQPTIMPANAIGALDPA